MEIPNIVFVTNNDYINYLQVAIRSLATYNNFTINIYIIYSKLNIKYLKQVKEICDKNKYNFKSIKINKAMFEGVKSMGYLKTEAYYRISIPNIIEVKKVLYLDCDILIRKDIREIFEVNLENYALAAVKDANIYQPRDKIKMKNSDSYFNTGVMMMNLEYWRLNGLTNIILKFAIKHTNLLLYADQCAINYVIGLHYVSLGKEYNFQSDNIIKNDERNLLEIYNSKIIHFSGKYKPTHYLYKHPLKKLYLNELKQNQGYCNFIIKHKTNNLFIMILIHSKKILKLMIKIIKKE
jgi:lipopolysaccharide biosynthesis glycosyltransferase